MPSGVRWIFPALLVILFVVSDGFFVVTETQQVIITQFGKPVGKPITKAGLYVKIPIIQKVNVFEKRVLKWDGNPTQIPTRDKKYIWVDTTARWRIGDPLLFLMRVGTIQTAHSRLDGIIDSIVRDHVANNLLVELVRSEGWEQAGKGLIGTGDSLDYAILATAVESDEPLKLEKGREKITREMVATAVPLLKELGIELLDIRIKRINYIDSVQQKVFDRMISERKRIAAQYRSEGEGERAVILGQMQKELAKIRSEAFMAAQKIRGQADAEATRIYAEAYGKDPDFFDLSRSLEVYRNFSNPYGISVFSTKTEAFKYLKGLRKVGE
ncbi:MAG: protease modulator HflC [Syntrophobacterales bacterium]|nr:protease modulator HflC [Syntrophobacterales bacterium]